MRKFFISIIFLMGCESLKSEKVSFPEVIHKGGEPPYVMECMTERENVEIDPYSHIWKIRVEFSRIMDTSSVEKNTAVYETDGLKEGMNNIVDEVKPREVSWDYDGTVMFYTVQLSWGKWYFLKIGKEAKDLYGNSLDGRSSKGARADDDFSSEPSDFYSLPFRVGGASTSVPLLKGGINTPVPYRLTYSPFIEKVQIFHKEEIEERFFEDNFYLSLDGMYGKGIIVYPEEVSFTFFFKVPSKEKISAESFSAKVFDLSREKEIPLLFRDESTGEWFENQDEISDFVSVTVKSKVHLEPLKVYKLEVNPDGKTSDKYGIRFVDLSDDEDNTYRLYFATCSIPFTSPIPPSPLLISLSEGTNSILIPNGGLFHRINLENLYDWVRSERPISYGEEAFPSPNTPHTPTIMTLLKSDGIIYFSDEFIAGNYPLDTDGDGIGGGIFRKSILSRNIPILTDPYEPDDTIFQAYPLTLTSCEEVERTLPAWDTDFFSFAAEITSTVNISEEGIDIAIKIYDENGGTIGEERDEQNLSKDIPPGRYYIQVLPLYPPRWDEYNPPIYTLMVCLE